MIQEMDIWRPLVRQFSNGEDRFPFWTFWPSTVFTAEAVRALLEAFEKYGELITEILRQSKLWAVEEVVFPSLLALLGFDVRLNPCTSNYIKFRAEYSLSQLKAAFETKNAYWIHPVPRIYDDELRVTIRSRRNGLPLSGVSDESLTGVEHSITN